MPSLFKKNKQAGSQTNEKAPAQWTERGYTGTQFFSGYISNEEYLNDLTWQQGVTVYDRMRRSDGQIKGVLQAIMLPIRQAHWYFECEEDSKENIKIAYELENDFLREMDITWDDTLRQILTYLIFGFAIFEKVYAIRDNRVVCKKLAPRIQKTLYKWDVDENGVLTGIQQYVIRPNSKTEYINISADKLVLFVNEQEGSNFEGISILRPAYKHWFIKDELYKVDAIGHDRFSSGIPWAKEPPNASPADQSRAETVLSNLHSREKSWIKIPNGWELGIFEKSGSNESIIKSIQHHNEEIAKNVLAQFINLGTTQSGSRSLGESFEELFLMSINTVANYICEIINRNVIKEICDYNYTIKDGKYPKLKCAKIMLSANNYVNALKIAKDGGLLQPDIDIENHVRELYGLQKITEDEDVDNADECTDLSKEESTDAANEKAGTNKDEDKNDEKKVEMHSHGNGVMLREFVRKRELSEIEKVCCDIDNIEKQFAEGTARVEKAIDRIRNNQFSSVARQAVTRDPADIRVPSVGEMAKAIYDEMEKSYNKGRADCNAELTRQVMNKNIKLAETSIMHVAPILKRKAKAESVALGNKLVNNALFQIGRLSPDIDDEDAIKQIVKELKTTGSTDIQRFAAAAASYAYGLGREDEADENSDEIEYAVYSSILDGRACENCLPKDMVRHELDDSEFTTPSPECLGGEGNCRCVNIYKMKDIGGDFAYKSKDAYEADKKKIESGNLDAEKMRSRYELPKYKQVMPEEQGFGAGK